LLFLASALPVTRVPAYPPPSHALHAPLMKLARGGRVLFGSDLPNVAVTLPDQIQTVFHTFADQHWFPPTKSRWWTDKREAQRAGKAVEQILFGAATSLLAQVDVSKAKHFESSKM